MSDGKLLCLIRHGQGKHNARPDPRFLWHLTQGSDPELTSQGASQARALRASIPSRSWPAFELVVVSPLSRTIQTAHLVFGGDAVPKRLCALCTERCCARADVGTPKSRLAAKRPECSQWDGLDELEERWWPTQTLSHDEFWPVERVGRFKTWLLSRPESCMALVGHKGFTQCFTAGSELPKGHRLGNCEAIWVRLHADGSVTRTAPGG